jgi:hypothetical protein
MRTGLIDSLSFLGESTGPVTCKAPVSTKTSLQHHRYVTTAIKAIAILKFVMKGWQRAFVIQFSPAAETDADRLSGRIEHVASGCTATFQSLEELTQLLKKMLESVSSN